MEQKTNKYAHVGKRIRDAREFLNLRQTGLVNKTGIAQGDISQFESGKRIPSPEQTALLAKALRVEVEDLVTAADRAMFGKQKKAKPITTVRRKIGRPLKTEVVVEAPKPKPQPAPIKEKPKMQQIVQPTKPTTVEKPFISTCRAVSLNDGKIQVCALPLVDGGVEGSGFCADCYSPELVEKHHIYRDLLGEGYKTREAAAMAGLTDPF